MPRWIIPSPPFTFTSYGAHRDLHSFPTRRSSDLRRDAARGGQRMSTELYIQDVTLRDGMHAIRHRIDPADVARVVEGDRKSTRLKSSHSARPYALFCWKNKTERDHRSGRNGRRGP